MRCASCRLVYLGNPPPENGNELYEDYHAGLGGDSDRGPDASPAGGSGAGPDGEPGADPVPGGDADLEVGAGSAIDRAGYHPSSVDPKQRDLFFINRQRVSRLSGLIPEGELLDIGCGKGQFLWNASQAGYDVHGLDVSARAVAYARERFGVSAEVGTLDMMVSSGRQFDVVTLWHVLEHFTDPFQALRSIHALLREGGVCVIEVPNLYSLKFMLSRSKWEGGNHPLYHRTFFSAATLGRAIRKAGFRNVRRKRWSYTLPERSGTFEVSKRALDLIAMDAFLDFVGRK